MELQKGRGSFRKVGGAVVLQYCQPAPPLTLSVPAWRLHRQAGTLKVRGGADWPPPPGWPQTCWRPPGSSQSASQYTSFSPPGAAGVERAGCSVGPGAGPGGAVPPSPRLGPRPSALGCLHHRLRPQDGLRNIKHRGRYTRGLLRRSLCGGGGASTPYQTVVQLYRGQSGNTADPAGDESENRRELTKEALKRSHRQISGVRV